MEGEQSPSAANKTNHRIGLVTGLAFVLTFLNSLKPLHVDDTYFHYYASQIAQHPLDPFGFEMFWWQKPVPAHHALAPPVFLYWWGLGIAVFGNHEWFWKWWLLGVAWLFVFALHALLRRFVRRAVPALLTMIVISPVFLPSFNLMIDIPALALGLSAIVVFFQAAERHAYLRAIAAGVLAGLAMQTKYTALVVPGVFLADALVHRRWRLGLTAAAVAAAIFASWELLVAWRYGESSFLYNLQQQESDALKYFHLALPLITILGGVAPTLWLLSLAALKMSGRVIAIASATVALGYALVFLTPAGPLPCLGRLTLTHIVLWTLGAQGALAGLAVIWRLFNRERPGPGRRSIFSYRTEWFLVLWLLLELCGYFILSPFAAARRVMGIYVVATLLIGRLAARTCREPSRQRLLRGVAAVGMSLGLVFYAVDLREAQIQRKAAIAIARRVHQEPPGATCWFVGGYGLQYYAEVAGFRQVVPNASQLRAGDLLAVPDARYCHQHISLHDTPLRLVDSISLPSTFPVRTLICFYAGRVPLEHHDGPWMKLWLYRVCEDFVPRGTDGDKSPTPAEAVAAEHERLRLRVADGRAAR